VEDDVPRLLINNELAGVHNGIEDDPQYKAFMQAINDPKGDPQLRPLLMMMVQQMVSHNTYSSFTVGVTLDSSCVLTRMIMVIEGSSEE
jgi:hypothetical protein